MTELRVRRPVACPAGQAPAALQRWFTGNRSGERAVVSLRAPIAVPGLPALALQRECVVHVRPVHVPGSMVTQYDVDWASAAGGPFPAFTGRLSVPDDEDYQSCFLVLDGSYEPPLGPPGATFDRMLGHRIAETTANDLLARIGAYLEASYRAIEAEKAARRAAVRG